MSDQVILAESKQFTLVHVHELAALVDKRSKAEIPVGDHYGNPNCGLIAPDQSWCITGGEGVVIWLDNGPVWEGFRSRRSGSPAEQLQFADARDAEWVDSFGEGFCRFVHAIKLDGLNGARILLDPCSEYASTWLLDIESKILSKIANGPNLEDESWADSEIEF